MRGRNGPWLDTWVRQEQISLCLSGFFRNPVYIPQKTPEGNSSGLSARSSSGCGNLLLWWLVLYVHGPSASRPNPQPRSFCAASPIRAFEGNPGRG